MYKQKQKIKKNKTTVLLKSDPNKRFKQYINKWTIYKQKQIQRKDLNITFNQ